MQIRSRRKTTGKNIFIRYMTLALAMGSGLLMVPLYIRFIPLDVYGVWLASGNILVWIGAIDPGLTTVLQQRVGFAYGKRDFRTIRDVVGCGLIISALVSLFIILLGSIAAFYLSSLLKLPATVDVSVIVLAFFLAVVGNSLNLFSFSISAINQGLQSSLGYGLVYIIVTALALVLQIILLHRGFGILALAIGSVFCGTFYILGQSSYLIWRFTGEKIGFRFSFSRFSQMTKLLSYTFLGRAAGIVANNFDLFIVARFLGPESVAVLSLTRKAPIIARELVNQPSVAFMPAISHLAGAGEMDKAQDILMRLMRILIWALLGVLGGLIALNGDFVKLWVGAKLFAGKNINLMLCIGIFINLATYCLGSIIIALGNIKGVSIANLIQSVLFVILVIFGTEYFGLWGTIWASLISVCAVTLWYYPKSFSEIFNLTFKNWKSFIYESLLALTVMTVLIIGFSFFEAQDWLQFLGMVILFCSIYAGSLYAVSKNFRREMENILKLLTKIR
ncbi:MAG: lipopolysaccharide biosynthesis protein [Victivallaceae bacterium]|nr:lipopolysaccharide biosynthesis protein [Victivallaceae bacterium]